MSIKRTLRDLSLGVDQRFPKYGRPGAFIGGEGGCMQV
jgi:hypothetical protein